MDDSTKLLKSRIQQVTDNLAQVVYDRLNAEQCKFARTKQKAEVYSGSMRNVLRNSRLGFDKFDLPSIKDGDERITAYKRGTWHRDSPDIESLTRLPLVNNNDWDIRYFYTKIMKTRIMEWMRSKRGLQIVLLKQEQIDLFGIPVDLIEDLEEVVRKVAIATEDQLLQDQRLLSGMARLLDGESKQMSAGMMLRLITMVASECTLRSTGMNRKVIAWISLTTFWIVSIILPLGLDDISTDSRLLS